MEKSFDDLFRFIGLILHNVDIILRKCHMVSINKPSVCFTYPLKCTLKGQLSLIKYIFFGNGVSAFSFRLLGGYRMFLHSLLRACQRCESGKKVKTSQK